MALNCLLVVELLLYVVCFFCGIVTAASVAITQGEFAGECILYGTVRLNGTNLTMEFPSSQSLCYFVTTISVCVAVYCLPLALCCCCTYSVARDGQRGPIWMCVTLLVSVVFSLFLLVTGCVLRFGRNRLCESIVSLPGITRCEEAQDKPWSTPYVGTRFFSNLHDAETSVWVTFFSWLVIFIAVVIQMCGCADSAVTARGYVPSVSPWLPEFTPRGEVSSVSRPLREFRASRSETKSLLSDQNGHSCYHTVRETVIYREYVH